jgi:nucleoside-diphosphate-sugar epimerase
MAIHLFIRQIHENKPLTIYGDGTQTRDFTYIDDIVHGTIASAETENIGGEVFNLGSGSRITLNDLLKLLAELIGDFEILYEAKKKGDVAHTLADISKAKTMLGYNPRVDLKKGLSRFIKWYRQKS